MIYKANEVDINTVCEDIFKEKNITKENIIDLISSSFENKEKLKFIKNQIEAVLRLSGEFDDDKLAIKDFSKDELKKFFKYLAVLNSRDDDSLFISTRQYFEDIKKLGKIVNDSEKYNIKVSEIREAFLDVVFEIL